VFASIADYRDFVHHNRGAPRISVFCFGVAPESYAPVVDEAIYRGDCLLVVDEAWEFCPPSARWPIPALRDVVLAGRHLVNGDGDLRPVSFACATQYPKDLHHTIFDQATHIDAHVLRGELAAQWVRGGYGADALARVQALSGHQKTRLL
jgi:hypothetical protein